MASPSTARKRLPVVEDVKGFRTKEYELKKKLMAGRGIHVVEV